MADATKQPNLMSEFKSFYNVFKTRRTVAFAYGFMFVFVAFTVFLAFNPSSNSSSSLWFTNIFSSSSVTSSSPSNSSYRSQFSSIFSYFLPSRSSAQNSSSSFPVQFTSSISDNTVSQSHTENQMPPSKKTGIQSTDNSDKGAVLHSNQTETAKKEPTSVRNQTQTTENISKAQTLKANQTAEVGTPKAPLPTNQSTNSSSLAKEYSGKGVKVGAERGVVANHTDSLSKKQSDGKKHRNGGNSDVVVKQGTGSLMDNLMKCDLFDGEWIRDDSYPLYKPGTCSFIDKQFSCVLNGRPDRDFQKMKWKPKGCILPRLDGVHMLKLLRGKRLVFVGDSLNRNMWESLVCILRSSAKDPSKVFEANRRHHFRGEASYSFIFQDYNFSVEFFVSPFLVQEWKMPDKNGSKKETLRLDLVGRLSYQYKDADIIIFNTGHWWTHEKTSKGKDYYQEGNHVYAELNALEAFQKALTTWARWVDAHVNPSKSMVFFRGYSATHFSGGQWNSGGACDSETEPIKNEIYLKAYAPKMKALEKVLKGMKTHVTYLNITRLTDFRKDGHPSIYRKQRLTKKEKRLLLRHQDCSHWCLPGVPDAWNELFYAELLIKQNKMLQHQNQKRYR